jgi:hypothetical protein
VTGNPDVLARACGWIDRRLESDFRVARIDAGARDEGFWASLKAVAELAHAADFLMRDARQDVAAQGRRWLAHAWAEVGEGEVIGAALAADPRFLPAVLSLVPFHLAGRERAGLDDIVARQLRAAALQPLEWTFVVPALELLGLVDAASNQQRAMARQRSVLARPLGADMARDDVYILVHECYYASRWGHEVARYDGRAIEGYVGAILAALIRRACAGSDADLLAELILASRTTLQGAVDPQALEIVERAQTAEGNIQDLECPAECGGGGMNEGGIGKGGGTSRGGRDDEVGRTGETGGGRDEAGRVEGSTAREPGSRFQRLAHPTMSRTYHTTLAAIMAWAS